MQHKSAWTEYLDSCVVQLVGILLVCSQLIVCNSSSDTTSQRCDDADART